MKVRARAGCVRTSRVPRACVTLLLLALASGADALSSTYLPHCPDRCFSSRAAWCALPPSPSLRPVQLQTDSAVAALVPAAALNDSAALAAVSEALASEADDNGDRFVSSFYYGASANVSSAPGLLTFAPGDGALVSCEDVRADFGTTAIALSAVHGAAFLAVAAISAKSAFPSQSSRKKLLFPAAGIGAAAAFAAAGSAASRALFAWALKNPLEPSAADVAEAAAELEFLDGDGIGWIRPAHGALCALADGLAVLVLFLAAAAWRARVAGNLRGGSVSAGATVVAMLAMALVAAAGFLLRTYMATSATIPEALEIACIVVLATFPVAGAAALAHAAMALRSDASDIAASVALARRDKAHGTDPRVGAAVDIADPSGEARAAAHAQGRTNGVPARGGAGGGGNEDDEEDMHFERFALAASSLGGIDRDVASQRVAERASTGLYIAAFFAVAAAAIEVAIHIESSGTIVFLACSAARDASFALSLVLVVWGLPSIRSYRPSCVTEEMLERAKVRFGHAFAPGDGEGGDGAWDADGTRSRDEGGGAGRDGERRLRWLEDRRRQLELERPPFGFQDKTVPDKDATPEQRAAYREDVDKTRRFLEGTQASQRPAGRFEDPPSNEDAARGAPVADGTRVAAPIDKGKGPAAVPLEGDVAGSSPATTAAAATAAAATAPRLLRRELFAEDAMTSGDVDPAEITISYDHDDSGGGDDGSGGLRGAARLDGDAAGDMEYEFILVDEGDAATAAASGTGIDEPVTAVSVREASMIPLDPSAREPTDVELAPSPWTRGAGGASPWDERAAWAGDAGARGVGAEPTGLYELMQPEGPVLSPDPSWPLPPAGPSPRGGGADDGGDRAYFRPERTEQEQTNGGRLGLTAAADPPRDAWAPVGLDGAGAGSPGGRDERHPRRAKEAAAASMPTDLHRAVSASNATGVDALLASGVDPDSLDDQSRTPLHVAALTGGVAIMARLLAAGANPEVRDDAGHTPLHLAVVGGQVDACRFLARHGVFLTEVDPGFIHGLKELDTIRGLGLAEKHKRCLAIARGREPDADSSASS